MQNRKILTLEEVLNLDRRPTLQEMVDLSKEDYTKYLYYKGIIKYIPENLEDYQDNTNDKNDLECFDPEDDIVLDLKNPNGSEIMKGWGWGTFACYWDGYKNEDYNNPLNESLINSIDEEYGVIFGADGKEYEYGFCPDDAGFYCYHVREKD
ncbi:MAG: hypothetical protein FWC41_03450 [Firmicutes bacterium]|nr:hypothetical protein [Bacillota bacterium]